MTAPLLGEIRPCVHRFVLGEAEVTTILDGAMTLPAVSPPFAMDMRPGRMQAIAAANRLPDDRVENTFTPTLVNTGSALVLFDVGFGGFGRDKGAGNLRARLADAGYAPEDVDIVAFTHMHPDHIAGVMEGDALAFPNARHVIGRHEFDEWSSGENIPVQRQQNREMFLRLITPLADRLEFVDDGQAVAAGITAEAAYGHSLGHMMYRVESAGKSVLIWGDVANHYVFSVQYPENRVAFDDDPEQAISTRKRVLNMVADGGTLVIGHHMPFPSVGYVERAGDSYRWVPATYQLRV
ncbi:MAG: MBL fold metallo-hydrolase [Rhodobacter sp.]|nr:MBL fold metallo-hydrolase [Rhodobacter sp.]